MKPTRKIGMVEAIRKVLKPGINVKMADANGEVYPATISRMSYTEGDFYVKEPDGHEMYVYIERLREIETDTEILTMTGE